MALGFRKFISEVFVNGKFPKILPFENFLLYGIIFMAVLSNPFLKESNLVEYCTKVIVILDSVVNTICIPEGPGDPNSPFTSFFQFQQGHQACHLFQEST